MSQKLGKKHTRTEIENRCRTGNLTEFSALSGSQCVVVYISKLQTQIWCIIRSISDKFSQIHNFHEVLYLT